MRRRVVYSIRDGIAKKKHLISKVFLPAFIVGLGMVGVFIVPSVFGVGGPPPPNPSVSIDQCDNGGVSDPYVSCDNPGNPNNHWGNGALNSSKAHWQEGDVLPYRAVLENLNPGVNTVTFSFDTTKASEDKHAIDYLASYDYTETTGSATSTHANQIDPCGDVFACTPSSPTATTAITVPSYFTTTYPASCANGTFSGTALSGQLIKAWSAAAGGVSAMSLSYPDGAMPTTGDCAPSFKITFTVAAGTSDVVIAWGGHIAANSDPGAGGYWGVGNARPTGSPYHMRAGFPQESPVPTSYTVGSQDLQLSSDAIIIDPRLTLVKTVVNDNGGLATITDWTLSASGPTPISGTSGSATVTDAIVDIGTYTLSESGGPFGYSAGTYSCIVNGGAPVVSNSIALVEGDVATCTITNDDTAPSLTLVKTVINDNGGNLEAANFPLFVDATGVTSGVANNFSAGSYTASETNQTGYTAGDWGGDCAADGSITLAPGDNKTCTINNNDQPAHLVIIKGVINDNGGSAVAGDFSGGISGVTASGSNNWTGTITPGVDKTLTAVGDYVVSENAAPGYSTTYSADCSGTIALGETKTCTVTNNDQQAYVIVDKTVINDNGGSAGPNDFLLTVNGNSVQDETAYAVNPGTYTAGETLLSGYTAGAWGGDCNVDASVTVALGETKTCTITNDDQQAYITVVKIVTNDNGGSAQSDDFNLTLGGNSVSSGVAVPVNPGTYTAGETLVSGYSFQDFSGDCDGQGGVTVALGESKTCTLTNNDQQSYIIVDKTVINNNGGTAASNDFLLTVDGNAVSDEIAYPVNPGNHTAGETNLPGYSAGTWGGDCNENGGVSVALGETKTCTISNDDIAPTITLIKEVINDNGGTAGVDDFGLEVGGDPVSSGDATTVDANTPIVLSEDGLVGYDFVSISGDRQCPVDNGGTVTLDEGQNITCTITNDDRPGELIVNKIVINDNNGTAVADDFVFQVNGGEQTPFNGGQKIVTVDAGTYTVTEPAVAGYDTTYDNCTDLIISNGGSATCTITNNDSAPPVVLGENTEDPDEDPPPQVLAESLTNTGTEIWLTSLVGGLLISSTLLLVAYGRHQQKQND